MRILICGGTGVIGRHLVPLLVARGHDSSALARSDDAARRARAMGAQAIAGDILDPASLDAATRGQDVVIHAATSVPRQFPGRPADFVMNDRVRREGTAHLLAAAERAGVRRVVSQSIVWVHGDTHGAWIDEDAPLQPVPLARSAVDLESQTRLFGARTGAAVSLLRCGAIYAADSFHTREIVDRLRRRLAPIIGRGESYQCFVHADDVAQAFLLAAESAGPGGTFFVTDDEPVQLGTYLGWVARAAKTPEPLHIPHFMARLAMGQEMVEAYTASLRCRNDRIKRQLGWTPKYPGFRDGYAEVLPKLTSR